MSAIEVIETAWCRLALVHSVCGLTGVGEDVREAWEHLDELISATLD